MSEHLSKETVLDRTCEFCGCKANARQRLCCVKGERADREANQTSNERLSQASLDRLRKNLEERVTLGWETQKLHHDEVRSALAAIRELLERRADETVDKHKNWAMWQCIEHGRIFTAHAGCSYCREGRPADPTCAVCDRRHSEHKTVISHDFRHRRAEEPSEANSLKCVSAGCQNNCEKGNPYLCAEHASSSVKATQPLPDHLKPPVKAGDPCPAIDDVHTEHEGKCVYCGAPIAQVKAEEPTRHNVATVRAFGTSIDPEKAWEPTTVEILEYARRCSLSTEEARKILKAEHASGINAVKASEDRCKCGQRGCSECGEDPAAYGFGPR